MWVQHYPFKNFGSYKFVMRFKVPGENTNNMCTKKNWIPWNDTYVPIMMNFGFNKQEVKGVGGGNFKT